MSSDFKLDITPRLLLRAYGIGVFPMAEDANAEELLWFDPQNRGILPLDEGFHLSRRFKRTLRQHPYGISVDRDFYRTIASCAAATKSRPRTWINTEIIALFCELHNMGHAHSVEVWEGETLVGGLYGVALGAAFFGESMFSHRRETSKIALTHLVGRLRIGGFHLLDTQFVTDHLRQFGAIEIYREQYKKLLAAAIAAPASFYRCLSEDAALDAAVQPSTVTS
jgi:leucyl/phenylalanyl-tRNA--protein transferase